MRAIGRRSFIKTMATAAGGGLGGAQCANAAGPIGCGTVYRLAPPAAGATGWARTVLKRFDPTETRPSTGLLFDYAAGVLYGATSGTANGTRGSVFELVPSGSSWTYASHIFGGGADGANPIGSLLLANGTIYGTTAYGGTQGLGTIFSMVP